MKIMVVDQLGSFSIVKGLREKVGNKHKIATMTTVHKPWEWELLRKFDPDVVFCDWADSNAARLSHGLYDADHFVKHVPLIVRLHGYESHDGYVDRIAWNRVMRLITVSPYFKRMMHAKLRRRNFMTEVVQIANGVDLERFKIREDVPTMANSIAWLGYLNMKKGPALLRCVAESYPTMLIDVAGKFQCENTLRLLTEPVPANMRFYDWVNSDTFLPGHAWILSTSVTESFSYAIAEGMACGLTPMVHAWPGAAYLWPHDCCWRSMSDLGKIKRKEPQWCRNWVKDRYSAERQIDEFIWQLESL